ncbi:MAG: hypothetical protein U9Q34_00820 [Elusimicrobiota bacterium]|nr:hypothetical protein [Elusimicrobiota bacterium]
MLKIFISVFIFFGGIAHAEEKESSFPAPTSFIPDYVSLVRDMSKFYLYANGGFHADWYVGYNNAWIIKLPPVAVDYYAKAFIGAKIGRAKIISHPKAGNKRIIPGKIYMGISNKPGFTTENMYFLIDSSDLPLEPLPGDYLKGIDSAQWFWAEIPLSAISSEETNYLAIWSSSRYFKQSSNSPIIAAALSDDKSENVWLNRSISGNPPLGEKTLEMPINGVKPAMAIKFIPKNPYRVIIKGFRAEIDNKEMIVSFTAIGEDIHNTWLELSYDKFDWQRVTKFMFNPPYYHTFENGELSEDMFYLRAAGVDALGNIGYSSEIIIPSLSVAQEEEEPEEEW